MMFLGSAWYPEQWHEERWRRDLELMRSAGMNVARIGEYSWSRIEHHEGQFDLDWLQRAIDLASEYGVKIVLGTPTDSPPAWLTQKYPEVLRVADDRRPTVHGARRHFSPVSAKYRELCARIVAQMARRFAANANVIGWQIGNEFCMYSYDPETQQRFQGWLRQRYGTLEALNEYWTTQYWSEAYSDWSQVLLPSGWPNPGLDLAMFHFMSEMFAEFQRVQMDIIRKHSTSQWITHNIHGWEDLDFTRIIQDADLAAWDPYPGGAAVQPDKLGWYSDLCRTLKPRPHWVIEAQPGHVNWMNPNAALSRGALRAMAWHFYAHGAEAVLFWQWRAALSGQEQYHGTLIAPDGEPRPLYDEVVEIGRELKDLSPALEGSRTDAKVAVLYSYADQYILKHQRHNSDFDPLRHTMEWYGSLRRLGLDVDGRDTSYPVEGYALVVAPHLHTLSADLVDRLERFVKQGGHLLLGPRSGFKDTHSGMLPSRQPGEGFAAMLGAHVDEYYSLDRAVSVNGELGQGEAVIWSELLTTDTVQAQVLLRFGKYNGWIDAKPAMVTRTVGKGRISYLAAWLNPELMQKVMQWATQVSGVTAPFEPLPAGVEICRRKSSDRELLFVINHGTESRRLDLKCEMHGLMGVSGKVSSVTLEPYGVVVLSSR